MAVSIDWDPLKGLGFLQRGVGLIYAMFRVDSCKNYMAVLLNWVSFLWVSSQYEPDCLGSRFVTRLGPLIFGFSRMAPHVPPRTLWIVRPYFTYIHIHMYLYMYIYIYTQRFMYITMYVCEYIHAYLHTYIPVYIVGVLGVGL